MITSNKLAYFQDRLDEGKRPITADIYLTDYCNNTCRYCRFGKRSGKAMSYDMFVKVYERLHDLGVRGFILTGGGEPTINPDFGKITAFLESVGASYGVNTNFNVYREFTPVFLKISIDEGERGKYKDLRGVDKLMEVVGNVCRYRRFLDRTGGKTRVGVQCVANSVEQVKRFHLFVSEMLWAYVDYIQFRPVEMVGENLDYTKILEYIDHVKRFDRKVYRSYKFDHVGTAFDSCPASWAAITVDVEGMVHYCCNRPDMVVGSIFDEDILAKKAAIVPDMSKCERPCRLTGANVQMRAERDREINFI